MVGRLLRPPGAVPSARHSPTGRCGAGPLQIRHCARGRGGGGGSAGASACARLRPYPSAPRPWTRPLRCAMAPKKGRTKRAPEAPGSVFGRSPPPCVTFRLVVAPLRGPGRSPVLPFACCVGSLLSVGRCGRCSCWCRFRVRGAQWLVCWDCAECGRMCRLRVSGAQ